MFQEFSDIKYAKLRSSTKKKKDCNLGLIDEKRPK